MSKIVLSPSELLTAAQACHRQALTYYTGGTGQNSRRAAVRFAIVGLRLYALVPGFDPSVSPSCEKLENLLAEMTGKPHEAVQDAAPADPAGGGGPPTSE